MRNSTVPGAGLRRVMGADVAAFVSEIGIGPKPRSAELIGRMAWRPVYLCFLRVDGLPSAIAISKNIREDSSVDIFLVVASHNYSARYPHVTVHAHF